MPQKGKLFYTVGNSRSGKTSFAKLWSEARPMRVVISGDSFRHAVYAKNYVAECEGLVFAHMDVAIKALLLTGFDVLVDETSSTEQTILRYLRIDLEAEAIHITTDADECVRRALADNKAYLEKPIRRFAAQLEQLRSNWDETVQRLRRYLIERSQQDVKEI